MRSAYLGLLTAFAIQWAGAQPFGITAQVGATTLSVAPGGTLNVAAQAIGTATSIRINVSYRGSSTANITGVERTSGGDFTSTNVTLPLSLTPSSGFTVPVTYTPLSGQATQAQILVTYLEGTATAPSTFVINISGTAPDLVYSYAFAGGNAQAVGDGALVQFPATSVNTTRTANFTILNRGTAPASVSAISLTGAAFQLGGLQIAPFPVNANGSLAFTATFAPTDRTTQTGTLTINFAGRNSTFQLQGTGISANYGYSIVRADGTFSPVLAGQALVFPDTNISSTNSMTVRITNNGNGPGTINSISAVGTGFQVTATPFLPVTLAVGAQADITLSFAPTTPGNLNGGLKIGDDTFTLSGQGVGSLLIYSYAIGGTSNTVAASGTVLYPPTKIGESSTLFFTVTNTGNAAAAINTIFLSGSGTFGIGGLPTLPFNLLPTVSKTFTLTFSPTAAGVSQGNLQVGNTAFNLSGAALAPDPIPGIILDGQTGAVEPLKQPVFKLSLRQPYAGDLIGQLNLQFSSTVFATDPSVQFATGGRTVGFFIPAGLKDASFPDNSLQVAIQTGTVAGTITIFPTIGTSNGIDLTPTSVPVAVLTIASAAPKITGISIANQTANGLTLAITGYATSRSVTQIGLQLTPVSGQGLAASTLTIPVDTAFQSWYQSTPSQSTGSAFTVSLPLNFAGNSTAPAQLTKALQSIAVTLTNTQGTSPAQTVVIP